MPDITMCVNKDCAFRFSCYRFVAVPNEHYQSYAYFDVEPDGCCSYFIQKDKSDKEESR